jgi:hypothetical protein
MIGPTLYESRIRRQESDGEPALSGCEVPRRVCYTCRQTAYAASVEGETERQTARATQDAKPLEPKVDNPTQGVSRHRKGINASFFSNE